MWRWGGSTKHSENAISSTIFKVTGTFKRPSLRLFKFKISQFVPFLHFFDRFCGFLIQKGQIVQFKSK